MEQYKKELERISAMLKNFYTAKFKSSENEYETNQTNKQKIKQLIQRIKQDQHLSEAEQQHLVNEALMLLAKNTGSAEDNEIAEKILDHLFFELKVINQADIDQFYQFSASQRWE